MTHLLFDENFVVIADAVFTQKIELNYVLLSVFFLVESDVLDAEGAATDLVKGYYKYRCKTLVKSDDTQRTVQKNKLSKKTSLYQHSSIILILFITQQ